jgi:hypothetical protein
MHYYGNWDDDGEISSYVRSGKYSREEMRRISRLKKWIGRVAFPTYFTLTFLSVGLGFSNIDLKKFINIEEIINKEISTQEIPKKDSGNWELLLTTPFWFYNSLRNLQRAHNWKIIQEQSS